MGLIDRLGITPAGRHPVHRMVRALTGTRPGVWVLSRTLRHIDRLVLRLSGGRSTLTGGMAGLPTILLTTTGARTGQARVTQLVAVPFGDDLAVIGSNFGRSNHPGWVHNLAKNPLCTASFRGRSVAVEAHQLIGADAEQVWAKARNLYHGFAIYPALAGARSIRVFALMPAG